MRQMLYCRRLRGRPFAFAMQRSRVRLPFAPLKKALPHNELRQGLFCYPAPDGRLRLTEAWVDRRFGRRSMPVRVAAGSRRCRFRRFGSVVDSGKPRTYRRSEVLFLIQGKRTSGLVFRRFQLGMDLIVRKLVLLLLLAASTAPSPWAHDHAELSPEQLSSHLRLCHSGSSHEGRPHGWHVHFEGLEACLVNDDDALRKSDLTAQPAAAETDLQRDLSPALACIASLPTSHPPRHVRSSLFRAPISGCELFQTFGALRI